ncbi:family transcriptional regulator : MerR family transcriptional regulator OS=Candidatus Entotheonella sp. TSY2 GN=ETSY2_48225 PE=4 SV=1: MerR: MerR-DNA-bind [Gemmataceae bacterium]|nr:family transcriptional regulator : MerR family transcriptional regulator OS=Candidatus Entotheonella sp. TSY2 GN=ETSY2_48225 PE=4 SV=1: MerR: MerR-DNA-bind [Gemmataceae bacterium]VTU01460.1 family transcriptional regulator : MerR family transcriptional regulator OS=Candidatus Entotheonella sp. TSY2 GN=ETSY2_48225 PE=4 SV=1: MerR: MerR-DNA-bind [Gemmataceae bacterium]
MRTISIGKLAKEAGIGVETVRFYERKGLLDAPNRKDSGYRQYDDEAVQRLRFIRRAQQVGFTLKEIQDLLALRDDPDARRADVRDRATGKVADIDAKVRDLLAMRESLVRLLTSCDGDGPASGCPIITALGDKNGPKEPGEMT